MERTKNIFQRIWSENNKIFNELAARWGKLVLFIRPIIIAFVSVKVWQLFRYYFPELIIPYEDRDIFQVGFVVVGSLHAIIAGLQFAKISGQKNMIPLAILKGDGNLFLEIACVRMSIEMKSLLGIFSLVMLALFSLYPFIYELTGKIFLFAVIFVLYLVWEMSMELDDPFHGARRIKLAEVKKSFNTKTYNLISKYLGEEKIKELNLLDIKYKS